MSVKYDPIEIFKQIDLSMPKTRQGLVEQAKKDVPFISCEEYNELRSSGADHVLIDVREQDEWDEGHIQGAVHIPMGVVETEIEKAVPNKETSVVVYCRSGGRAALCGKKLQKMGYTNVMNLQGGYGEYCQLDS